MLGQGLAALLSTPPDPRRREPRIVEGVQGVELVGEILAEVPEDPDAILAPRRRDDEALDVRPVDTIVRRRFVHQVQEADWNQHHAGPHIHPVLPHEIEVCELDEDLVGVLDLELAVEDDAVRELVTEIHDRTQEVGGVLLRRLVADVLPVEGLAVATDRETTREPVDLRGRGTHSVAALQLGVLGDCDVLAGPLKLRGHDLNHPLELRDAVLVGQIQLGRNRPDGRVRRHGRIVGQGRSGEPPDQQQQNRTSVLNRHRDPPRRYATGCAHGLGSGFWTSGLGSF